VTNEALREAEVDARIDHRTLAAQGIDREPLPHIPKAAFEMERHGYRNELAERLRDDYRARVEARLERAAARETAAAAEPAAAEPAASEFVAPSLAASQSAAREPAAREPAASERATAELSVTSVAAKPQTLEDIRREARENWLRMRQSQGYAHGQARGQSQAQGHDHGHDHDHGHGQSASAAKTDHSRDDDFAR
jgi:hypothetical protein